MAGVDAPMSSDGTIVVRPLLTAAEVAAILNVGERTVWRLASRSAGKAGRFPKPIRLGRRTVRWRYEDVAGFIEKTGRK